MDQDEFQDQKIASLKRTHQEAQRTLDNQIEEIERNRNSALRTFRTTVLLIGVLLTGVTAFRGPINDFMASPAELGVSSILTTLLTLSGISALLITPLLAIWAVKDVEVKTGLSATEVAAYISKSNQESIRAELTEVGWHLRTLEKYADWIAQNDGTIEQITFRLKICHSILTYAPFAIVIGLTYN